MDDLVKSVQSIKDTRAEVDDTLADRLSSKYTAGILMVFCVLAVTRATFTKDPITCWMPVHFHSSHVKYTNSYCWIFNNYYVPWEQVDIPSQNAERQYITYYQWIPFIFAFQAALFYLPCAFWHAFNSKSGVDLDDCVQTATQFSLEGFDEDKRNSLVLLIDRFLNNKSEDGKKKSSNCLSSALCCLCSRRISGYMVILFLLSKMFYIANAIGQLFLLNKVLGFDFHNYGVDVMTHMVDDHQWADRPEVPFPRVTLCDLDVRRLGQPQRYTIQCVLPLNIIYEKTYIFLWFWFIFIIAVSSIEFAVWLVRFIFPQDRVAFVENHVGSAPKKERESVKEFTRTYLRQDGVLLLRLIAHNTDHVSTVEIVSKLYDHWTDTLKQPKQDSFSRLTA